MSDASPQAKPHYRLLTPADLPGARRLCELAKWNQTERDLERLLTFEPRGCFAAEMDGQLAGTATVTRFEPAGGPGSFAWIGMVLADPERRGLGIGSTLLQNAIAYLKDAGVETLRLDATPMGKKLYEPLGFTAEWKIERWEGTAHKVPGGVLGPWELLPAQPRDLDDIAAFDAPAFGASRRRVLEAWLADWPEPAIVARREGEVAGYALARKGAKAQQLGPIVSRDDGLAEALLMAQLQKLAGESVIVDLLAENAWAVPTAKRCGLAHQRPFVRMALGPGKPAGKPGMILAICCPELG
ncbi:MAG: GNAT family N-acetyltransferase [Planctomycetes bacterium]|nr:GNAT family N-acetyltransferase [Planctomycetota bacterium]